jgi:hypothetical protein
MGFPKLPLDEPSSAAISDGELELAGSRCYRHRLSFESPLRVSYEIVFAQPADQRASTFYVAIGLCDDGKESYALSTFDGDVFAIDQATRFREASRPDVQAFLPVNDFVRTSVVHDGKAIETTLEGTSRSRIPCGPLRGGGIFLLAHTESTARIRHLAIEGRLDELALRRARQTWVANELASLMQGA